MKILFKTAVMTALLLGSGLTQAATTTSSIPMGVDVPKSCTLSNVSAGIILPEDGSEAQGAFSLLCNTGSFSTVFSMDSKAAHGQFQVTNPNGVGLPIEGAVSLFNYDYRLDHSIGYSGFTGQVLDYIVKAKLKSPTTATTPVGVYTDTFRVNVTY